MKENGCSKLLLAEEVATQHRVSGRKIQKQQFDTEDHWGEGVRIFILRMGGHCWNYRICHHIWSELHCACDLKNQQFWDVSGKLSCTGALLQELCKPLLIDLKWVFWCLTSSNISCGRKLCIYEPYKKEYWMDECAKWLNSSGHKLCPWKNILTCNQEQCVSTNIPASLSVLTNHLQGLDTNFTV